MENEQQVKTVCAGQAGNDDETPELKRSIPASSLGPMSVSLGTIVQPIVQTHP